MDDKQEIMDWELAYWERAQQRMYKTAKVYTDPRAEKLTDFRRSHKQFHYNKECKWVRKWTNRLLRRKLSRNIYHEEYYRVTGHDYKTSGWITW